ncbi:MAG: hypothetical protein IKV96_01700 [Firmicutes bacterium]|nr:hypothetical protein [Bacillota bacterium]
MGKRNNKKLLRIIALVIAGIFLATTLLGSCMYIAWADTSEDYFVNQEVKS